MNDETMSIAFDESGQPIAHEERKTPHKTGVKELKETVAALQLDNEILTNDLEKARAESEKYLDLAQRSRAEFENFKKRTAESTGKIREDGIAEGIIKILPVFDALMQASTMITDESTLKGIDMVTQKLLETFRGAGVERIESAGREFNPDLHNAIMNEETDDEEMKGKIAEVFQEGFRMGTRILRYAMVKVAI